MKKILILLCLITNTVVGQLYKVDTTITNEAYTAYVNKSLGEPLYVKYKLYKGGGDCKRSNHWSNDTKLKLVDEKQYEGSNYQKGHLVNAEDFAYNCHLDSMTFRFYNRIPQTKKLNIGIWKENETLIRKLSQTDSLIVYCGGYWDSSSKVVNGMKIPNMCWKVVYSLSQKKVIMCNVFTNTDTPIVYSWALVNLESMLGYSLGIPTDVKKKEKKKK
jgi:DNA/RNA endonuclease G (NUC1)